MLIIPQIYLGNCMHCNFPFSSRIKYKMKVFLFTFFRENSILFNSRILVSVTYYQKKKKVLTVLLTSVELFLHFSPIVRRFVRRTLHD